MNLNPLNSGFFYAVGGLCIFKFTSLFVMNNALQNFKVPDRQKFIEFLNLLQKDIANNKEAWENKTLPDFLEALGSYTEDIQGYYGNMKQDVNADHPSWQLFADMFKGATIYE